MANPLKPVLRVCPSSAIAANFSDNETPSGSVNGSNTTFTLSSTPDPSTSLRLFVNGVYQTEGEDYSISSGTITMSYAPPTGSIVRAFYRY